MYSPRITGSFYVMALLSLIRGLMVTRQGKRKKHGEELKICLGPGGELVSIPPLTFQWLKLSHTVKSKRQGTLGNLV